MYGIIGYPLLQTFSPRYFNRKFKDSDIDEHYEKFPLDDINNLKPLLEQHPDLKGLNVTIPYKQDVMALLDALDDTARAVGAVNTIRIEQGKLTGYNTDTIGFKNSLAPLLQEQHKHALVLGTGGASKAVVYALQQLGIAYHVVSRKPLAGGYTYEELTAGIIASHTLIINTTPLGMVPLENEFPALPYTAITAEHLLYDLIYHPEETLFLQKGKARGAAIKNGYDMLIGQAEAAWNIWQSQ